MGVLAAIANDGRTVRISPEGRFDFNCHREFRDAYSHIDGGVEYVIDLRRTQFMDSSALGMLLLLREHAGGDTARITIENPAPEIRSILEVANFDKLFDIR
jgi:anti-anti-sigma factor